MLEIERITGSVGKSNPVLKMGSKIRQGRRNLVESTEDGMIRKTAVKFEPVRPNRLGKEAWALIQAKEKGINVPRVISYGLDPYGREAIMLERIFGKVLTNKKSNENVESMFSVGSQLSSLRGVSSGFGWVDPVQKNGTSESWKDFMHEYVEWSEARMIKSGILSEAEFGKVHSMVDCTDLHVPEPYLVHRDIKPSNIMRDSAGTTWIIDWENVMLGDPIYDIAMFGMKYGHGVLWKAFKEGYGFKIPEEKYDLYEMISLIGMIDFYHTYKVAYDGRKKQLIKMIGKN